MTLKVLIVEDEIPAQMNLKRALQHNFDDLEVVGTTQSIRSTVEWLDDPGNKADIIFMDVELSDGKCFEVFKQTEVRPKVIITTAYDEYAIKAFRVNSVDYLLKPLDTQELIEAVGKCRERMADSKNTASGNEWVEQIIRSQKEYKRRFTVKLGDKIIIIAVTDIAYVYSETKTTYIVTFDGNRYITDLSLDSIMPLLDPGEFFRVSRACIATVSSIKSVMKHLGGRLKVVLEPPVGEELFVSRSRTQQFLNWLEGENG